MMGKKLLKPTPLIFVLSDKESSLQQQLISSYGYVSLGIRGSSLQDWTKTVVSCVKFTTAFYFSYIIT